MSEGELYLADPPPLRTTIHIINTMTVTVIVRPERGPVEAES